MHGENPRLSGWNGAVPSLPEPGGILLVLLATVAPLGVRRRRIRSQGQFWPQFRRTLSEILRFSRAAV